MPEAAKAQLDYTIPSTISINGYSLEITDEYDDTSVRKKIIDMCDAMNIDVSGPDGSLTLTVQTRRFQYALPVPMMRRLFTAKMQRSPWEHSLPRPMVLAIKQMVPVL